MPGRSGSSPLHGLKKYRRLVPAFCLVAGLFAFPSVAFLGGQDSPGAFAPEKFIGPGVRLLRWERDEGPHSLYAVEVDATEPLVRLGVSLGRGERLGLEPLSRQAERLTRPERYPIAGVNGDFFYYPGMQQPGIPTNAAVVDGELVRTPFNRSCLVVGPSGVPSIRILRAESRVSLPGGASRSLDAVNQPRDPDRLVLFTPRFGASTRAGPGGTEVYLEPEAFPLRHGVLHRARVLAVQRGTGDAPLHAGGWVLSGSGTAAAFLNPLQPDDMVELRIDFVPALGAEDQVMGGGPRLVREGKVSVETEGGSLGEDFARARHPRTAIGFNGKKVYLVVVDGRQPGYSIGMTLPELAQVMADLGCTDALNMDGGGSSTLWARGAVVNRPSDGRERAVADALLVFSTAPKGDPVRITPTPVEIAALSGAEVPVTAVAEDRYYNPIPLAEGEVAWTFDPALGALKNGTFTAAGEVKPDEGQEYRSGTLMISARRVGGSIPVRIYPRPARVEVLPAQSKIRVQARSPLRVRAYDSLGRRLLLPPAVEWQVSPEVGSIDGTGTVSTGEAAARGSVTARVSGVTGTAQVEVTEATPRPLDDFEGTSVWAVVVSPPETVGAVTVAEGTARSGKHALKLEYDFTGGTGTRTVSAVTKRTLRQPLALKLWAYGDGQGVSLRVRILDGKKEAHLLDLAPKVDWKGSWHELRAPISEDLPGPVTLDAILVSETDSARKPRGAIFIDDLSVEQ